MPAIDNAKFDLNVQPTDRFNHKTTRCLRRIVASSAFIDSIPVFEIRTTTKEIGSNLRAPSEREIATNAETLIRRVHTQGELSGFSIVGPSAVDIDQLKACLDNVLIKFGLSDS